MRRILLALCLFAAPLQAQFVIDSTGYTRQYSLKAHWKKLYTTPDSQYMKWGFNYGGTGLVATYYLARTDTMKVFWPVVPSSAWSIWTCVYQRSAGVWKNACNSFGRLAVTGGTVTHDTVYIKIYGVAQWVFPRDTIKLKARLALQTCDTTKASIDSITGLLKLGCNLGKKVLLKDAVVVDSGVAATLQMCMVSILSDSTVIWAKQSKAVCPDSIPRKKYGLRWHPELPADTTLIFSLGGANWH